MCATACGSATCSVAAGPRADGGRRSCAAPVGRLAVRADQPAPIELLHVRVLPARRTSLATSTERSPGRGRRCSQLGPLAPQRDIGADITSMMSYAASPMAAIRFRHCRTTHHGHPHPRPPTVSTATAPRRSGWLKGHVGEALLVDDVRRPRATAVAYADWPKITPAPEAKPGLIELALLQVYEGDARRPQHRRQLLRGQDGIHVACRRRRTLPGVPRTFSPCRAVRRRTAPCHPAARLGMVLLRRAKSTTASSTRRTAAPREIVSRARPASRQ